MRKTQRGERAADEAVLRLVQDHAAELLRFARRFSHCADDAHDAYQVSIEILVRRMRVDPPEQPLKWLRTVLRHEALAIRAQREQLVGRVEVDLEREEGRHFEDPSERTVGAERLAQAAEALRRLKPQEVTALVLRAEGLTYKEICARTGWTYTRCNRAIYEGRLAFAARLRDIESGAECERWAPLLSALADGEASAATLAELRPHLRACASCRATLREFQAAPAGVAALVPPLLAVPAVEPAGSLLGQLELLLHGLGERVTAVALRAQGAVEGLTGAKVAAVAASTAALAGGGAAIEQATRDDGAAQAVSRPAAVVSQPDSTHALAGGVGLRVGAGAAARRGEPDRSGANSRRPRSEFAARRPRPEPEFAPRAARVAEFASASAPSVTTASSAGASSTAATTHAPAPAPRPTPPRRQPPEFGGP